MRMTGALAAPTGCGSGDHLSWVYDDRVEAADAAAAFLADGLGRGEQVAYLTPDPGAAGDVLDRIAGAGEALAGERLRIVDLQAAYVRGADQVQAYRDATDAALAAGFTGYRVAAEATDLVRTLDDRAAFLRYEQRIDGAMRDWPFAAMCMYDRRALGAASAWLACVHPAANRGATPFRLLAADSGELTIEGEVDAFGVAAFLAALDAVDVEGEVAIDGSRLTFLDHRALLALEALDADRVTLTCGFRGTRRLAEILELEKVAIT